MPENDNRKQANDMFGEWNALFSRMKNDADYFNLKAFTLMDVNNHPVPNAISVTLNDAGSFVNRVEAALGGAVEQVVVESENKRFDTAYVETFIKAAFKAADELLPPKRLYPFNRFIDQQACRRGRVAARCLFQVNNGVVIPDITPYDTGYFVHWQQKEGPATAYKTTRSKAQIQADYPQVTVPEGRSIEVLDIWTAKNNELWIAGQAVKNKEQHLGYPPIVWHTVPVGSMLLDLDSIQYEGESVLFLIRDILLELHRLASIIQSLNQKAIDHALQRKQPQATLSSDMKKETVDEVTALGVVNYVPSEGGYELMPIGDVQRSAEMWLRMCQERVDDAMGKRFQNLGSPKTATEIMAIGQEQDMLIGPRIATRGLLKQDLAKMAIKQVIESGERTVKIGGQTWEVGKLKGEYTVEFAYHFKDPRMDIARTSMAAAQRGLIPDSMIRRETLMLEDPEEAERQLSWEAAGRDSALIKLRRSIIDLIKLGKRGDKQAAKEARIRCYSEYCPMLEQAMMGVQPTAGEEKVKPSQPLVPLLAAGA